MLTIHDVTDADGVVRREDLLYAAIPVHRQLRPMLPEDAGAYGQTLRRVFAGGARMKVATDAQGQVRGVALWRVYENTYEGRRLYLDDLVADEAHRSRGVGKRLLDACEATARDMGCAHFALDSGTWRTQAHKLYFREGFVISSFHFTRTVAAHG